MTSVKHKFVSLVTDDPTAAAAGEVLPSHWNDEHSVSFCLTLTVDSLVVTNFQVTGTASFGSQSQFAGTASFDSGLVAAGVRIGTNELIIGVKGLRLSASGTASVARFELNSGPADNVGLDFQHNGSKAWTAASYSLGGITNKNFTFYNEQLSADGLLINGDTNEVGVNSLRVSATASVGFLRIGGNSFAISLSQSVATGQVLTYNNADNKWRNITPATGTTLLGLTDVSLSQSVATGQVLTYNNADNKWRNVTPVASSGKLDGTTGFAGVNFFKMSADWTAYQALELDVQAKGAATTTNLIIALYTDGGTTPILTFATNPIASATASEVAASFMITGTRNQNAMKVVFTRYQMFNGVTNQAGQFPTSTFTTSAINAIGIITGAGTTTTTMSSADIFLYGRGA